jgi:DNA polymerase I
MTWLLIDGNNWFAQCEYACPGMGAGNFKKRLDTVLGQLEHTKAFVCWDGGKSWRCEVDQQYKAHREAKADWYRSSLTSLQEEIRQRDSVVSVVAESYEADDLLATLVSFATAEGEKSILFSADKDLHQLLVEGSVTQVTKLTRTTATRMQFETISAQRLHDSYGVWPYQWVDYRSIVGDGSDGIKGCPGLGPKAAQLILQACGLLDKYYDSDELRWKCRLTPRQRTLLDNYKAQLPHKRRLLELCDSVPLPATFLQTMTA